MPADKNITLDGVSDDLIHKTLEEALGITRDELANRLDAGETFSQIGVSLGFDLTTIREILAQARADALNKADTDRLVTPEQEGWLHAVINFPPPVMGRAFAMAQAIE